FTSLDPMLSSGSVNDPQTWNRYAYALNNPLKYVDLLGLFVWGDSLGGSLSDEELRDLANNKNLGKDRQIYQRALAGREAFRNARAEGIDAATRLGGSKADEITRAVSSYGDEGVNNHVTVNMEQLAAGVGAQTEIAGYNFGANGRFLYA